MRRVLHVIETMAPREGGPPRVVAGLAVAQCAMGIDAHVLCGDGDALPEYLRYWEAHAPGFPSASVHSIAGPGLWGRRAALRVWLRTRLREFDVVHIHQLWRLVPTVAASAARVLSVPYLIAPHTSLSPWALSQKSVKKRLARWLAWDRIFRGASGFHALNQFEAAEIRGCLGAGGAAVFVVPNGVSLGEFAGTASAPAPAQITRVLSTPEGARPFVLFLARLHTMKGPDLLLEAFARLAQERPALQLVFAGPDFGLLRPLQRRAAQLQLLERVHFLGLVSGSCRLWLLENAVCLSQPSRDEGSSLSILEGLACARPVVISEHCKFPEVATQQAGVIVPLAVPELAAALHLYAQDPARRRRDGRNARRLVESCYTWDTIARQAEQMYVQAVGGAAPQTALR